MTVLKTGVEGFIVKNVVAELEHREEVTVLPYDVHTPEYLLEQYCMSAILYRWGRNRKEDSDKRYSVFYNGVA